MNITQFVRQALCGTTVAATLALAASAAIAGDEDVFIPRLINTSTVPANGDGNPYGVAFVPLGFPAGGAIAPGDVLVSNFNNSGGTQGTGTTIIKFTPGAGSVVTPMNATVFFMSQLPGLSTALEVLKAGFVIVGNVPTTDGSFGTIGQGALQVIDRNGNWVQTLTDPTFLDGPWDLAVDDHGSNVSIFVSNVISGTVSRLDATVSGKGLTLKKQVTIASGYAVIPSSAAVVLGPTGLAYDGKSDTLYVASTGDNAIYAVGHAESATTPVANATKGTLVFSDPHLQGPLALKFAPNGHLLTTNGDATPNADPTHPSEVIEFTRTGKFIAEYNVDVGQGGAFGIDVSASNDDTAGFAAVDDVTNTLAVYGLHAE